MFIQMILASTGIPVSLRWFSHSKMGSIRDVLWEIPNGRFRDKHGLKENIASVRNGFTGQNVIVIYSNND